jgi:short-subunit dehydrogenase
VLVSSEAHCWATYSGADSVDMFKSFASPGFGTDDNQYYVAKLFIALFSRELASRIDTSSLTVTTTTPGFCASGLFRDTEGILSKLVNLTSARSVQYGGQLHVHTATVKAAEAHGQYFRDGHPAR